MTFFVDDTFDRYDLDGWTPDPAHEAMVEHEDWLIDHDAPETRPDGCSYATADGVLL